MPVNAPVDPNAPPVDPNAPAPEPMSQAEMQHLEQKLLDLVSKARIRAISRCDFFGYLLMQLRPMMALPHHNVPTAGIAPDGTVVINPDFMLALSIKEAAGVLAHEVMHPVMKFWDRKGTRNHVAANIAHDLSFNFMIEEAGKGEICLPDGVLLDPKFHGMSMEEIYSYLQNGDNGTGKTTIKCKGGGSVVVDTTGAGGEGFNDCREDLSTTKQGKAAAAGDKAAQRRMQNEWKINVAAAAQKHEQAKGKGSLPAGLRRWIDQLLHPKLDWQEQLQRWCGENGRNDQRSYRRPSRRSEALNMILPSLCDGGYADIIFLIDSSGSMSESEIRMGLSEAAGCLDELGSEIRVLVCDAAVHVDMTVEDALQIDIKGGGGSNFNPAFDIIDECGFEGAVIAITDGMIDVPSEMPPRMSGCLWLTAERYSAPTETWGEHIQIDLKEDN